MNSSPTGGLRRDQLQCLMIGTTSKAAPEISRIVPDARLIHVRCRGPKDLKSIPRPYTSASHHRSEPSQTPTTKIAARAKVAPSPARPTAEKMPRKARIVIGLVRVSANVER